jgi:hypothetical protein
MKSETGNGLLRRQDFLTAMWSANIFSRAALGVAHFLLCRHMNGTTGRCDPAISRLAKETGMSEGAVKRAIRELNESGWWIIGRNEGTEGRGGRTNTYRPNFERGLNFAPPSNGQGDSNPTPLDGERGLKSAPKGDSNPTPKQGRNQEEDSHTVDRSATDPVHEDSPFDDFWRSYPSRTPHPNPKKPAQAEFKAALKRGVDPAAIIRGAANYSRYVDQHITDRRYVAQAVTWLREKRWEEYQEPPVEEPARRRIGSW